MPDEKTVVRYAEACRDAASLYEVACLCPEGCDCADRAAALRALAALCEEIERGNSDDCSPDEFCNRIAAGYREGR